MFHAGHVAILKQAREFGDYLIAGVHSDEVVNAQRGFNMPIMNLNERVLSVLGCAYVNDVLIDAPLRITRFVSYGYGSALCSCAVIVALAREGGDQEEYEERPSLTCAILGQQYVAFSRQYPTSLLPLLSRVVCDLAWCPFPAKSMSLPYTYVFFSVHSMCCVTPTPLLAFLLSFCTSCLSLALRLPATLVFRICTPSVRFYDLPLFVRV